MPVQKTSLNLLKGSRMSFLEYITLPEFEYLREDKDIEFG